MKEKKHRYSTTSIMVGAVTVIAVFIMLGFASQSWQARLTLAGVTVKGEQLVSEEEILNRSKIHVGDNYETIDLEKVSKLVAMQPFVKKATARRTLHEGIMIEVTERIPVAAMSMNDSLVFVDEDMVLLPPAATHRVLDLPIITSCVANGKLDSSRLRGAVALLAAFEILDKSLLAMISEVTYRDGMGYVAFTADGGVPVRFGEGNDVHEFSDRAQTFKLWKEQYMNNGTVPVMAYIDMRFTKQVVVKPGRDIVAQAEMIH